MANINKIQSRKMSGRHQFGSSQGIVNVKRHQRPAPPICATLVGWEQCNCAGSHRSEALAAEALTLTGSPDSMWPHSIQAASLGIPTTGWQMTTNQAWQEKALELNVLWVTSAPPSFLPLGGPWPSLKTSCEDVLLTQVEIRQCNDQTRQLPTRPCATKRGMQSSFEFSAMPVDVTVIFFAVLLWSYHDYHDQTDSWDLLDLTRQGLLQKIPILTKSSLCTWL